ncbi:MAG: UDP-N-acetylmuramoyl-L-alanyl-D-glutamate--2,6-diaminopimelate ligase [Planctomycetota bacterium]
MQLDALIKDLPITLARGDAAVALAGLTDDSRAVQPGSLFIGRLGDHGGIQTLPGYADRMRYVPAALEAGAVALLLPQMKPGEMERFEVPDGIAVCFINEGAIDQRLCGTLAERFYGHPSKKLKLIGVTGTNGKTTTVTLTKQLLASAGHKCGLIGTVELDTGSPDGPTPAMLTTPGAIELSRLLAEMVDNGCGFCVMEVSSHALHQGRTDHLRFSAAAFTNLTQDHLDYHGSMPQYADAKAILFEQLDKDAFAILNGDDMWSARMARGCCASVAFSAVLKHAGELPPDAIGRRRCCVRPIALTAASSTAEFHGRLDHFTATVPMPGLHNLSNALQAIALAYVAADITPEQLKQGIESAKPVPGRLEPVGPDWPQASSPKTQAQFPTVLVDYAHTPDALQNVGKALRDLTTGKLITVFGCGGDRDRAKRPLMAKAAQQHADIVVLTSDNPRTEDPQQILDDAAAGFDAASGKATHTMMDRAKAIRFAINLAAENDTVLIAGKGHEDYQVVGTEKVHFDDREQAAAALREILSHSPDDQKQA